MIASSEILEINFQKDLTARARFKYVLSDGREVIKNSIYVIDGEDAAFKLNELEPFILSTIQRLDSENAVSEGIQTAHKLATVEQVQYAWLKLGFDEDEHYKAYLKMKDIGLSLLALDLTDEGYAAMLNTTIEDATAAREYWEFLELNKATLESYAAIAGVVV